MSSSSNFTVNFKEINGKITIKNPKKSAKPKANQSEKNPPAIIRAIDKLPAIKTGNNVLKKRSCRFPISSLRTPNKSPKR